MRIIIGLIGVLLSTQAVYAQAFVAEKMRFDVGSQAYDVKAGLRVSNQIPDLNIGDSVSISIQPINKVFPDVSVYICHEDDARDYLAGYNSRCRGVTKGIAPYSFNYDAYKDGKHYIVFDNSYSMMNAKRGSYAIALTKVIPEAERKKLEAGFSQLPQSIQAQFRVDPFKLYIQPCGQENAFSTIATGDITFCSELLFPLLVKQREGAVIGIMMHEVGHTLLNLWGMPNWDNEETVDEFAIVYLYMDGLQEKAMDLIAYYEEKNSAQEAAIKLNIDDRHPVSIQRIRNIKRILRNPRPVMERWNKFLYPHMTDEGLTKIIGNAGAYGDAELARKILNAR